MKRKSACRQSPVKAPDDSVTYRTAFAFGHALKLFLLEPRVFGLIHNTADCGWLDGGCRTLAEALSLWLGSDLAEPRVLIDVHGYPQHVVVRNHGWYLDGDGVTTRGRLLQRWEKREGISRPDLTVYNPNELDEVGISFFPNASALLRRRLTERFDLIKARCALERAHSTYSTWENRTHDGAP
jgi:hypothetical protein